MESGDGVCGQPFCSVPSHTPSRRFMAGLRGVDDAVDFTTKNPRHGGLGSAAQKGAGWPGQFRTRMIHMESK
jgi:hypothetical protein